MSSRAQCPICIETYTARNALVCPRSECAFACCLGCAKQYLLGSHQEPHCMNCRYEYEIEFFLRAFTKSWRLSTYKTHRETLALEKEKAHLPAMMALVEQRRSIINLRTQRKLLEQQIEAINEQLRTLGAQRASREKVNHFRYKCPTDQCKGFLDAKMYCAMCDTGVCSDCFAPLADASDETHEAHVCNEEAKQNVTYIKRSAKPCPACGTMIQKISGCAQIFCTNDTCGTAFSWNTGEIERGIIHNPHAHAWFQNHPIGQEAYTRRMAGDPANADPCALPTQYDIERVMHGLGLQNRDTKPLTDFTRIVAHNEHAGNIARLNCANYSFETNLDLRMRWLNHELFAMQPLGDQAFAEYVQKRDKRRTKDIKSMEVFTMAHEISKDLLRRLSRSTTIQQVFDVVNELNELVSYCNTQLQAHAKYLNVKAAYVTANCQFQWS